MSFYFFDVGFKQFVTKIFGSIYTIFKLSLRRHWTKSAKWSASFSIYMWYVNVYNSFSSWWTQKRAFDTSIWATGDLHSGYLLLFFWFRWWFMVRRFRWKLKLNAFLWSIFPAVSFPNIHFYFVLFCLSV